MNIKDIRQELALLTEVPTLKGQHYAECLRTYEAASNQRELILRWFADEVIPQIPTGHASLLSIGCGAGELDVNILATARDHASSVAYAGLEPDGQQCAKFLARMEAANDPDVLIEAHNTRFESFKEAQRFDLVLMVHSLYYMSDPEQAIDRALAQVKNTGRLVILIASNDTLNELSSSFWGMEHAGSTWFSEDLDKHLSKRGLLFERERIGAKLDITPVCRPDSDLEPDVESSLESDLDSEMALSKGDRIADFIAQVPTGALPPRLRKMIFSYLEASSERDGDVYWLQHNVDAFTITACTSVSDMPAAPVLLDE